jgi:acyl-CoA thioester hydrolase
MKSRASVSQPEETKDLFRKFLITLDEKDFQTRASTLRKHNKVSKKS